MRIRTRLAAGLLAALVSAAAAAALVVGPASASHNDSAPVRTSSYHDF